MEFRYSEVNHLNAFSVMSNDLKSNGDHAGSYSRFCAELQTMAMGDHNAPEFGQCAHLSMGVRCGALDDESLISIKSLWQYNIDVMNHYGRRNAISYVTLQFLREVEAKGMDKIIQKKLLTEIELKEVLNGENPSMSLKELLFKVIRGFPNFKLLYQLYMLTKNVTIMGNIYDNYPKSPEQLPSWISQRNIALNEKL